MAVLCCSFLSLLISYFFFSSRRRHTRFKCDWSSDVCSSDLVGVVGADGDGPTAALGVVSLAGGPWRSMRGGEIEIGRASCRGRGEISGVAVSLKKKRTTLWEQKMSL